MTAVLERVVRTGHAAVSRSRDIGTSTERVSAVTLLTVLGAKVLVAVAEVAAVLEAHERA